MTVVRRTKVYRQSPVEPLLYSGAHAKACRITDGHASKLLGLRRAWAVSDGSPHWRRSPMGIDLADLAIRSALRESHVRSSANQHPCTREPPQLPQGGTRTDTPPEGPTTLWTPQNSCLASPRHQSG